MSGAGLLKKGLLYDAEVEFLESTGTQWIDTGLNADSSLFYEIKVQATTTSVQRMGALVSQQSSYIRHHFSIPDSSTKLVIFGFGATSPSNNLSINDSIHIFSLINKVAKVDGSTITTFTGTFDCGINFYLFARNGSPVSTASARIYWCKFYNGNTLVRDFIPVRVGQVGYMYDRISCQLFGNEGSGTFSLGPDRLKAYDTEIEYLQSDGTAHIDTGIVPTLSHSVEIEFNYAALDTSSEASGNLFGCLNGWGKNSFITVIAPPSSAIFNCWGNRTSDVTDQSFIEGLVGSWNTLVFSSYKTVINGTQKGTTVSSPSGNPVGSIYLFCAKNYANGNAYGVGTTKQIRSFKIYDGSSNLVMDLIPVRRGTTGYMYDKVSGYLFGNSGTGSFTLGNDKT